MGPQRLACRCISLVAVVCVALSSFLGGTAIAQTQTAVEYYYWVWNFYFVTAFPEEIAALDGGAFGGAWERTGQTFDVWTGPTNSALPACRFFSTVFTPKSSHFYTPYAAECASLEAGTGWQYEAIAFYLLLPDANGMCPGGTEALYRLYNGGMGGAPNHRFTRSAALFNQMRAAGWTFEGHGLTGVFACVPASAPPAPTAEGLWAGSTTNGEGVRAVILDTGAYYLFYSSQSILGLVQGKGRSINGSFSSFDARDFRLGTPVPATMTGSYVERTALGGTINESGLTRDFTAIYQPTYQQPRSLASVAGSYVAPPSFFVTVDAAGTVTGSANGCPIAGTASPRGGVGVWNLTLALGGPGCGFDTTTVAGVAFYEAANAQLFLAAVNSTNAFYFFIGNRNSP